MNKPVTQTAIGILHTAKAFTGYDNASQYVLHG